MTRCELYVEGPVKAKYSIAHDLVDDEKYKKHIKELVANEPVKIDANLETIKEEVAEN